MEFAGSKFSLHFGLCLEDENAEKNKHEDYNRSLMRYVRMVLLCSFKSLVFVG
jgi:hypothetical protein